MKLKKLLPFFLLPKLLLATNSDFSIVVDKPFDSALFDITQDYTNTLSCVGFSNRYNPQKQYVGGIEYSDAFSYLDSLGQNKYGYVMYLLKVNSYGEYSFSKDIELQDFAQAKAVVKTPTNGYVVGGYLERGELVVVALDGNGNKRFEQKLGTKNFDTLKRVVALKDGGFLVVATSRSSRNFQDDIFENGLGENDVYLIRLSSTFSVKWAKKFGTIKDDFSIDAFESFDGSFVVLYKTQKNVYLMRIDENGDKLLLKEIFTTDEFDATKLLELQDGGFIVLGVVEDEMQKKQVRLVKFDRYFNILKDRTIKTTYSSKLVAIQEFKNGNLMGVGYVQDTYNRDGLVMLFDSELSMLSQEHFGEDNKDQFYALTILRDSTVGVVGITTPENSQVSKMWMLKLDSKGKIVQKQIKYSKLKQNFYTKLQNIFQTEIEKGYITIDKNLEITLKDKSLLFQVSSAKLSPSQKIFLKKFSKKFVLFLEKNAQYIKTLEVNGFTSSEWNKVDFTQRYLNNLKLSMQRAYNVIYYIFHTQKATSQHFLAKILQGNMHSFSKPIMRNGVEDKKESRRVTFKITLD